MAAAGVAGGILLMLDKRVVSRLVTEGGIMWWLVPSRMWWMDMSGPSQGCMVLMVIGIDGCYGMNWWGYCASGICRSVLGVISMSLGSLVRGLEGDATVQL